MRKTVGFALAISILGSVAGAGVVPSTPVYFDGFDAPDGALELGRFASTMLMLRLEPERDLHVVRASADGACGRDGVATAPTGARETPLGARLDKHFSVKGSLMRVGGDSEYTLNYVLRVIDNCRATTLASNSHQFSAANTLLTLNLISDEIASKLADAASSKISVTVTSADDTLKTRMELAFGESDVFRCVSTGGTYRLNARRSGKDAVRFEITGPDSISDTMTVASAGKKYSIPSFNDIDASQRAVHRAEDLEALRQAGVTGALDNWSTSALVEKASGLACTAVDCNQNARAVTALLKDRGDLPAEGNVLLGDAWRRLDQSRQAAEAYERALAASDRVADVELLAKAAAAWEESGAKDRALLRWKQVAAHERASAGLTTETAVHVSLSTDSLREAWTVLAESAHQPDGEQHVMSEWDRQLRQGGTVRADLEEACGESARRHLRVLEGVCLRAQARERYAASDTAGAITYYRRAIATLLAADAWAAGSAAQYAFELANTYSWTLQRREALEAAEQSLQLRIKLFTAEHETTADSLQQVGLLLSWSRRFADARTFLERALTIRSRSQGGSLDRARTQDALAYVLGQLGEPEAATPLFTAAAAAFEQAGDRAALSASIRRYADMLRDLARYRESEQQYRRILKLQGASNPDSEAATTMSHLAEILSNEGQFEEALRFGRQAVAIRERGKAYAGAAASAHNQLGLVLLYAGKYSDGLKELDKSVELALREEPSPSRGNIELYNRALAHEYIGRYPEAERDYRESWQRRSSEFGADDVETANIEMRLANVLTLTGRYREAALALAHATPIIKKRYERSALRFTIALSLEAELAAASGDLENATMLARDALDIREKTRSESEWRISVYLVRLGRILLAQHRDAEATASFNRVLGIWQTLQIPDHPDVAIAELGLGLLSATAGRLNEAEAHCRRSLDIASQPSAPSPYTASAAQACLADAAARAGRHADAVGHQKRALDLFVAACGRPHPEAARLIDRYAEILHLAGDEEGAARERARAQETRARHADLEAGK